MTSKITQITKTTLRHRTSMFAAATAMALCVWAAPPVRANETRMDDAQLVELSRVARTPQQHAQAAKEYRLRAETLEVQATQLETAVARAPANQPPITYKFPSAFGANGVQATQRALQARRAAQEARALAHWHLSRAVETFFGH